MRSRISILGLAATLAVLAAPTQHTEPEHRKPVRDDLPPRPKPPSSPPPPPRGYDFATRQPRLLRRPESYEPNPAGHNGKRAMERRMRQAQRAAEKAARGKP
jgi:hypothetical protein